MNFLFLFIHLTLILSWLVLNSICNRETAESLGTVTSFHTIRSNFVVIGETYVVA